MCSSDLGVDQAGEQALDIGSKPLKTFMLKQVREPDIERTVRQGTTNVATFLRDYVAAPFRDFMTRPMWLGVLAFVVLYKLGDAFMGTMFNPFLLDLGFTKTEIAQVVKLYGLIATLVGTFAVMQTFGFSLNMLTLFGLVLAVGIVVAIAAAAFFRSTFETAKSKVPSP